MQGFTLFQDSRGKPADVVPVSTHRAFIDQSGSYPHELK